MRQLPDVEACVDAVLERVGRRVRLATPLGIGKPNHLLNALYRRAVSDPSIELHIMTALTLQKPAPHNELERRFFEPLLERIWGDYPDLDYERDRVAGRLPPNVRVLEFYLYAGKYLGNAAAQRDYISTNYTYVARDLAARGVNVVAQQLARGQVGGRDVLSLSSNADVSLDLIAELADQRDQIAVVGQVNQQLPFMFGDAVVDPASFDFVVDDPQQYDKLFGTPKTAISDAEYMIGLCVSTLIKDDGELQIGIGSLADALVYALKLRHEHNDVYRRIVQELGLFERFGATIERLGGLGPFDRGLFASTEMLVDGFQHLIEAGIVKRRVYDDVELQRLLSSGRIGEEVSPHTIDELLAANVIPSLLDRPALEYLKRFGIVQPEVQIDDGVLVLPDGGRAGADLEHPTNRRALDHALGERLRHGHIVHAAFFLGPESFYEWLRGLPDSRREEISMRSVLRINQLYGHEDIDRLHRRNARFVNTCMMITMSGAAVSDGLDSGQVVSGVGGQYNFVAMAHALPDGHSLLQVRATRDAHGETHSNIVWNYGHTTISRHQRDLVVTEYGVADLRGKTDEEIVQALLSVSDARFQKELLARAKQEGKLAADYEIPEPHRHNHPGAYADVLAGWRARGWFPSYPFGTDFTPEEQVLVRVLSRLKGLNESARGKLEAVTDAMVDGAVDERVRPYLERMDLLEPHTWKERLYQRMLIAELHKEL